MLFIKQHKIQFIVVVICLLLVLLAGIAFYKMFYPNSGSAYGDRLEEAVAIDDAVIAKIKTEMISKGAKTVEYVNKVRIIKFFIDTDLSSDKAKALSQIVLDNLGSKVMSYYDIEIFYTNKSNKDFPMIGYHSKNATQFTYTMNKVGEVNE